MSPGFIVASGKWRMKCFTDSAIELTWPGVPVTAWASMRPERSKTPAERSPHSRTIGLKAVRIRVCACSSTTAMRRFHMIWRSIWPMLFEVMAQLSFRVRAGGLPAFQDDAPGAVDDGIEASRDESRCLVLGDDGGAL